MTIKTISAAIALALSLGFAPAFAGDKSIEQSVTEARLEGRIATAILFNRHLNPFEISVDVEGETAILTGTVDEAIDKELAERVALNASGITRVDNRIAVDSDWQPPQRSSTDERSFGDRVTDATTTATVKSRLLWNRATSGLDIKVDTHDGRVSLNGNVASKAEKELSERIALDTEGVLSVDNRLAVDGKAPSRAADAAEKVGDAFSDSWITTRVKSSLLYSRNVDGLDITVETRDGMVMLGGKADTLAERDLAVEIAKGINGVKQVNASAVKIQA
jgi:osmotically-inducible protein OsmY